MEKELIDGGHKDDIYEKILIKNKYFTCRLGYLGMPLAVAFVKRVNVIGFVLNEEKTNLYK